MSKLRDEVQREDYDSQEDYHQAILEWERKHQSTFSQEVKIATIRDNVLKYGAIICEYCKHEINPTDVALDHKVPKSKGGSHKKENALVCCKRCNQCKHSKDYEDMRSRCSACSIAKKSNKNVNKPLENNDL